MAEVDRVLKDILIADLGAENFEFSPTLYEVGEIISTTLSYAGGTDKNWYECTAFGDCLTARFKVHASAKATKV